MTSLAEIAVFVALGGTSYAVASLPRNSVGTNQIRNEAVRFDDWAADIKKASAQADDLGSFKEAFTTVTKACGGCHESFRQK